jgi:sarcosine oxidase
VNSDHYVVVGAGLAGAATAWSLAGSGHAVTLVERTTPAAADGSSHGSARILRQAYADPFYARMVGRARTLFSELEAAAGVQLVTETESLDYGASRNLRRLKQVLDEIAVVNQMLSPEEAHARWPGIRFDTEVLLHQGMGVLDAESAVRAMVGLAEDLGVEVLTGIEIEHVERSGHRYVAVTASGENLAATGVVVAIGGWLPTFLDKLPLLEEYRCLIPTIKVSQEQALHFPYKEGTQTAESVWPTFIHQRPGMEVYSLPGGRDAEFRGQKIAQFNGGKPIRSAAEQDGVLDQDNVDALIGYVQEFLPGLVPEPYAETTCLFTNTPSEDFLIDTVDGITLLSPCSGHGAKFAPLIGQIAAGIATGAAPEQRFTAAHLSSLATADVANHG